MNLILRWPPTVNTYWRTFRGRMLLSEKGREYRKHVEGVCVEADVRPLTGPVRVFIIAYPPDKRKRDIDNLLKGIIDGCARGGCYEDDSQIDDLRIMRGCVKKGGEVHVTIDAAPAPLPARMKRNGGEFEVVEV